MYMLIVCAASSLTTLSDFDSVEQKKINIKISGKYLLNMDLHAK